ncbi:MAG: ZIP family metal transporter [Thermoproteota archaeon]
MSIIEEFLVSISGGNLLVMGLLGGGIITLLNAVGAIPVFFLKKLNQTLNDVTLGFAAGVMLAASFTSLIIPSIEIAGISPVIIGVLAGALAISMADRLLPHMHRIIGVEGSHKSRLRAIWLFVIAITLHNMPEGLSVGIGFGSGNISKAVILMMAIGLQNMPEGLSVAFSLLGETHGEKRLKAFLISVLSGVIEIPLCILGVLFAGLAMIVPYAMGFAAGAMIFVISDEIIPETHRLGHERVSSYGLITGLLIMLVMDVLLG